MEDWTPEESAEYARYQRSLPKDRCPYCGRMKPSKYRACDPCMDRIERGEDIEITRKDY